MLGKLFRFHKTLDVITLFHSPKSQASGRILSLLKNANTQAEASPSKKPLFELDVVEGPMTPTQFQSIWEYIGSQKKVGDIVKDAGGVSEALKILEKGEEDSVQRPIVVDWNNGKAVVGDSEAAVQSLIDSLPKSS